MNEIEIPQWLKELQGQTEDYWSSTLSAYPWTCINPEAQLDAIKGLIKLLRSQEKKENDDIALTEKTLANSNGGHSDHAEAHLIGQYEESVYSAACRSMAATAMLTPFVEGLFRNFFSEYGRQIHPDKKSHERAERSHRAAWNCEFVFEKDSVSKNIVKGVQQLAVQTSLNSSIPSDFLARFEALVRYRNKMFHLGVEWPEKERDVFQKECLSRAETWGKWFSLATTNQNPWIFYLDDKFIDVLLTESEQVIHAMNQLVRDAARGKTEVAP